MIHLNHILSGPDFSYVMRMDLAGALKVAVENGPGKRILTVLCDGGERSYSKLYNPDFLQEKDLNIENSDIQGLITKYKG